MLVQHILEFIEKLRKEASLTLGDSKLLDSMHTYFIEKSLGAALDSEQLQFLVDCYKHRWHDIKDKSDDYTLCASGINQQWIDLAKQLSVANNIPYLKILMPTLTNSNDPVDGSDLTETETLTNFFIGYGDNLLCRKRSLCDYLIAQKFVLSTRRQGNSLSIFTLDELSRLKRSQQANGAFSIENSDGKECFSSFWDFMRKKTFSLLAPQGETVLRVEIPSGLLLYLLELIEKYYLLKSEEGNFQDFKQHAQIFFKRMYSHRLSKVNFLYGQPVLYQQQKCYLIDVLLAVFEANTFNLDHEMEILSKFLFQFNPVLRAKSVQLQPFYTQLAKNTLVKTIHEQLEAYERCYSLLVSLFVTKFKFGFFLGSKAVITWDKESFIPHELSSIYNILINLVTVAQKDYASAYDSLMSDLVAPRISDDSWWTWLARDETTENWLDSVQNDHINSVGGYWFAPESVLAVLLKFDKIKLEVKSKFIDNLIHSYAPNITHLKKQLRVNILFSEFLSDLPDVQRKELVTMVHSDDEVTAKSQFIRNCASHIDNKLKLLGYIYPESSLQFFTTPLDLSKGVTTVFELLIAYRDRLPREHLTAEVSEAVGQYIFVLKQPILNVFEMRLAKSSSQITTDPIGAPT